MTVALTSLQQAQLRQSLQKYSGALSQDWLDQLFTRLKDGIQSILNPQPDTRGVETGESPATVRGGIADLLKQFDDPAEIANALNLDFKIKTAADVANGAGRFVAAQSDVDEYPAWAFARFYRRMVPRGFERGKKGGLIPVPDDDWPSRWAEAGAAAGNDGWLPWQGDSQTGRGVALKSSRIWQMLGTLRDDSLGNPFPPFAFNSGFDVDGISRAECVELGLLQPNQPVAGSRVNLANLFSPLA